VDSYDAYGDGINEAEFLANAAWFKEHLQPYGYDTVVIDFRWWDPDAKTGQECRNEIGTATDVTDAFGRLQPAPNRFPSAGNRQGFKPLADRIHAMGLKFGIHIMRGIPRHSVKANKPIVGSTFTASDAVMPEGDPNRVCPWCVDMFGVRGGSPAGEAWYHSIVQQYAAWGVDFIKATTCRFWTATNPECRGAPRMLRPKLSRCKRLFAPADGPSCSAFRPGHATGRSPAGRQ